MRDLERWIVLAFALLGVGLWTGCAGVSGSPQLLSLVVEDLTAAKANFDAAAMPAESACMQAVLDKLVVEAAADPQVKGFISLGSVGYIAYSRLQGSQQSQIPDACYTIIGKITAAVGKRGAGAFSGGVVQ